MLIGTVGFAAEFGWQALIAYIPWPPSLIVEGVACALVAGTAGGVLGGWIGRSVAPRERRERREAGLLFSDPEGLSLELRKVETSDEPLTATHPDIPAEHAIQGFEEVRAFTSDPERSRALFEDAMKFEKDGGMSWVARGSRREGRYIFDPAPAERGVPGAGTVHHVAWASLDNEQLDWRDRVIEAGANPTPVIDRFWFESVYFKEPGGALFELATDGPGFDRDEDMKHLGEQLILPPWLEPQRVQIEAMLPKLELPKVSV